MALEVEEVLALWRQAERLLDELPARSPERTVVSAEALELKRIYMRLTGGDDVTAHMIGSTQLRIEETKAVLEAAQATLDRSHETSGSAD